MLEVSIKEAIKLIKSSKPKIITVTFIKRTNLETRVMNCRLGVKKYLKGGELPFDPIEKNLLPVFDIQKQEYRMINLDTIIEVKMNKEIYVIVK